MASTSRLQRGWWRRALVAAALMAAGAALSGCGSMIADHLPAAIGGEPDGTPQRPANAGAYPAVHDMPPPRAAPVLSDADERKLEADLIAARNRAAEAVKSAAEADKP